MATEYLEHKLALLPDRPGCYLMKDINAKIIYVGKAKNLKHRVRSYFKSSHEGKTAKLVSEIRDFETIITSTDKEAFLLEITLIQKHQPYFNIKLKKGTGYPYIKITNERDPQMMITGQVKKDGGYYFGPYPNVYAAEGTLHFLQKVYPLRRCKGNLGRPCLYYHMGQCLGACFQEVPVATYDRQIAKIKSFLNGNVSSVKKSLQQKMATASKNLKFERAAELRDQIHYIEQTVEKQKIISHDHTPRDLFNYYVDKGWISIQVFFIRQARLMKREKRIFPCINTPEEELASFILQFYNRKNNVLPREILVPQAVDRSTLAQILHVPLRTPQRGQKRDLLQMAQENAKLVLLEKFRLMELDNRQTVEAQKQIFSALDLPYGHVIESFDHSHIQGMDPVSAMVSFVDGKPQKSNYRKYKIKNELEEHNGADEAANTREVIYRRYSRLLKEKKPLPDLILMDGGLIELRVVLDVLHNELGIHIPVAGMVKDNHHNTSHLIVGEQGLNVPLDPKSEGFYLLQRIQDEVHRFVISYHRKTHSKNALSSQLESIKGVGPKTRIKLLKNYGSVRKIKEAPVEDLMKLGVSQTVAQTIKLSLSTTPIRKIGS
ncbi:excinuclease ABC subunit UvrC [Lactobacillus sp. W8089]|uniref:excinuclease ABC subunit UvrC n=1 Tax=Bombilactobacillus mellis TaxID=1218508 RepID=UPI001580B6A5|nr:excinuclease ABC subunit UvrC [Bombilactobacillus mellis]MBI0107280.1 excinuclease ABC subunit UvrC [Lactobacillus sp. W8086]MBI0108745.1 excinuclease ABC subunit UvrC [Lactobacillus sp. W8085]MBI0111962.1 excinuclease ABC subunit UvrC [Lactobacillus sp. W8088]MBI0115678.1 excinuclease ABC subunit UvrC [Lactobacillus sp. W8087]MBI0119402.1 excinuclease ABC subunit UvrC [Lactobacillus sp. W8089]MBI0131368.1 excinuclease ABC subunit UvrC [Lactobacillus sp. W8090]